MKQYWSFFKSGKFAFLALFFVSLTVISCDKDDNNNDSPDPPIEKGEIEIAENAQALNYFDFINPSDVEILDADTTQIRVSQAYLDKIKTKINEDDVLSIWRSIDTPPFIRKVSSVSASGEDAILTTTRGTLADLIKHGDFTLSTELYVNYAEESLDNRYSKDGVYHPSMVIFGSTDADGVNEYATAEELLAQEATWHIFNKDGTTNYTFNAEDLSIGLKDVETHTALDLEIGVKISWFQLRNFDCYFKGEYKLDGPIFVEWAVKEKSASSDLVLTYFPPVIVIFPIAGPIHISVMVIPTLNMECEAHAKGTISITMPMTFDSSFKLGPTYAKGKGWNFYHEFDHSFDCHVDKTNVTYAGELGASLGVYFKTEVNICYCGGPFVAVGPSVSTELGASLVTGSDYQFKVNTNGKFKLGGKAGAELHMLGFSLGKWETEYNLVEKDVWNEEFIVDLWSKSDF